MKLNNFPLLADENIHPQVIEELRSQGRIVFSVFDIGLRGESDQNILQRAFQEGWVILTHDQDFGKLTLQKNASYLGILFLRPGHIQAEHVLDTLRTVEAQDFDVCPPFLLVVHRRMDTVRIRLRQQEEE